MTIPDYILEAINGSTAAKQYLYQQMRKDNWIICIRYMKNEQDAEDVLVDAFCRLYKKLDSFEYVCDKAFFAYTNTIVVNECLKRLGKNQLFIVPEAAAEDIEVDENILNSMTAQQIVELIRKLPNGYRTIFNLSVIEGYPHTEISKMLGITEGNSRTQLCKAKTMMQKLLLSKGIVYGKQK